VVLYRLRGGKRYHLLTAEPYTFGALNLIAREGGITVHSCGLRRVGFDRREIIKALNAEKADDVISRIYHAAVETFCQNTFDIYMDCPSRERAGWLCDSFFTSRVEHLLTGKSTVERAFLSNFAMADHFESLPEGMLPMCYPADVLNNEFIPNWAMWFVLELREYAERSKDTEMIGALHEKMYALLGYFRKFENADGLLENLENWVFVEWSKCNELTQDINYPTNMLYYRFKKALAELYGDQALSAEADALRGVIREKSRMGMFFCDNSVRDAQGTMRLSEILTETCQYYAFYMGIATVKEDAALWKTMVEDFGPERKQSNLHPEIHFSNAFIGNYLRLDLLSQAGLYERLEANIRGYFDYMAKKTDTLWENDSEVASCNHGFASHVLVWLDQLGYLKQTVDHCNYKMPQI
jgi:alpha-L-rhamnosidase